MIGTLEEAEKAYEIVHGGIPAPEGWNNIGRGATRSVYRSPSGAVYKVCWGYRPGINANDREHERFREIKESGKLKNGWRTLETYPHKFGREYAGMGFKQTDEITVLACEYVEGELAPWDKDVHYIFTSVGLCDIGGANWIREADGTHVIIDAGEPRNNTEISEF